jgi:Uma2 family endonuclease
LGTVTGAETGFQIEQAPDTVRAPDVGFVAKDRLPAEEPTGFFAGAPNLAVEVLSPHDRAGEVMRKVQEWLAHGCHEVWVADPETETLTVHHAGGESRTLSSNQTVCSQTIPGFEMRIDALFTWRRAT